MKYSLSRYDRHIDLPGYGVEAQMRLKDSKVCIIGAGGLGCPVALYLAAAGIGYMTLVDADTVSLSNLQRQILYKTNDVSKEKAVLAKERISELNPEISIEVINRRVTDEIVDQIVLEHNVIVDCSDNFETRYLINQAAHKNKRILISGAVKDLSI